jgi:hypothetical protein
MTDEELEAMIDAADVRTIPTVLPLGHVHVFRKAGHHWACRVEGCTVRKIR